MNTPSHPLSQVTPGSPFVLAQGPLMRVAPAGAASAAPWLLTVEAGAVWATWPGCQDDVFLVAGQQAEVPAGVAALVEVEPRLMPGAAMLRLLVPQRPAGPARGWKTPWAARTRLA